MAYSYSVYVDSINYLSTVEDRILFSAVTQRLTNYLERSKLIDASVQKHAGFIDAWGT